VQNELLEACAHALNILALEHFYCGKDELDAVLQDLMKKFKEKKRVQHWSKASTLSHGFCGEQKKKRPTVL